MFTILAIFLFGFSVLLLVFFGRLHLLVKRGSYAKANRLTKKIPILIDASGYLNPTFAAYIALRAKDIEFAQHIMNSKMRDSSLLIIDLLQMSIDALEGNWDSVGRHLDLAHAKIAAENLDSSPLSTLETAVADHDGQAILDYYTIGPFGGINSPVHDQNLNQR